MYIWYTNAKPALYWWDSSKNSCKQTVNGWLLIRKAVPKFITLQMSFCKPISPMSSPIFIYSEIMPVSGYIALTKAESQFSLCPRLKSMKPHVQLPFSVWTASNIHIFVCFFPPLPWWKAQLYLATYLTTPWISLVQPLDASHSVPCLFQPSMATVRYIQPNPSARCDIWLTYTHFDRKKKGFQVLSMLKENRGHNVWCGKENLKRENYMHRSRDISGLNLLIWCLSFFFFLKRTVEMLALTSNKCILK